MEDREKCVTFDGKVLTTETIKLPTNYTIVRVVQAASGGRHKDKRNKGEKGTGSEARETGAGV